MKKKVRWAITEESVFALSIAIVGVVFFVTSFKYPAQSRFFPTLVLVPLIVGMVVDAIAAARVPVDKQGDAKATIERFLVTAGWMVALVVLMALAGLVGAMALFPIAYMRFYCGEDWRPTLITAAVLGIGTYAFIHFLQIPMYFGVVLEALGFE